jgi:NAD(P)-dependent dehydrogenase (short-subunit alcohol dehydrogenase family)
MTRTGNDAEAGEGGGRGRLAGKVAVVTGAGCIGTGWGNGRATATLFAREGAVVHLIDRDADALGRTIDIITAEGGHCTSYVADVSQPEAVRHAIEDCVAHHSRIDILHNNVGVAIPGGALAIDIGEWRRALEVNLTSALLTSRHAALYMPEKSGGSIINVSSISGVRVLVDLSYISYPVSKAALNHMTKVMAVELGPRNIRCNTIVPGFLHTPMVEHSVLASTNAKRERPSLAEYMAQRAPRIPLGRWGDAWDVANAAVFLASDESRYITGIDLIVDGGATLLGG